MSFVARVTKTLSCKHTGSITRVPTCSTWGSTSSEADERDQDALRASAETWRKFAEETPEPMYHGIWSASFQRDLSLEGDLLVLMQNLRCFTRQFELLRVSGVPV